MRSATQQTIIFVALLVAFCIATTAVQAQVGFGGVPHPSAAVDVKSTDKAFYMPRMSTVQRQAIVNPQAGAMVFDLDQGTLYLHNGQGWLPVTLSVNATVPVSRTASDGLANDQFGYSVAISGDYAIISAYLATINGKANQGAVYIFMRQGNSWNQQAKLTADDGAAGDMFGNSVALSGDYVLIGAQGSGENNQGAAYIFMRSGTNWTQQAKLTADDAEINDYFGTSVSLSGDYALVGAPLNDINTNTDQGAAYLFKRTNTTWTQQQRFLASDGGLSDNFGSSVSISGDYALIGAYIDDVDEKTDQGSAYVWIRGYAGWTQQQRLTAPDGQASDRFGVSVSLDGSYALISAFTADIGPNFDQGAAYVFIRSGSNWTQQAKLVASDGTTNDYFGQSVSISGNYAIIGVPYNDVDGVTNQGSAYIYKRTNTTWNQVRQITDNTPAETRNGFSVGLSNGTFIMGYPFFQSNQGKVSFGPAEQ